MKDSELLAIWESVSKQLLDDSNDHRTLGEMRRELFAQFPREQVHRASQALRKRAETMRREAEELRKSFGKR